jgi:hypothetical protein
MDETKVEKELQAAGCTGPRLTPDMISAAIKTAQYYVFPGTTLTVCCVTLQNGYTVLGESACADPANYRKDLGEKYAYENAKNKIWALEGYLLKEAIHQIQLQNLTAQAMQAKIDSMDR